MRIAVHMATTATGRATRPGLADCLKGEAMCNAAFWVFVTLFVVQLLHFMEHVVQVHQIIMGSAHTSGVAGERFDFVEVHLAYNVGVFVALVVAWLLWRREPGAWKRGAGPQAAFAGIVLFQGYHAAEHVYQAYQYWALGMGPRPPGLIGQFVPNPIAHFDLNLVLTLWMTGMLIFLRPRRLPWGHPHPHGIPAQADRHARAGTGGLPQRRPVRVAGPDAVVRLKQAAAPRAPTVADPGSRWVEIADPSPVDA